jgi:hypothetical protein
MLTARKKKDIDDTALQLQVSWYEVVIEKIHNRPFTIPKDLPEVFLEGFSTEKPPPTTITY